MEGRRIGSHSRDFSQVDVPILRYKTVNFGAEKDLSANVLEERGYVVHGRAADRVPHEDHTEQFDHLA